jgi:hypothetical protein
MLSGTLDDILLAVLRKVELGPAHSETMREVLRAKLAAGEVLLLVDGLDEISDAAARVRFCRKLEQIPAVYPDAAVIATSRIVGYREMNYHIGRGFEHVTVAELSRSDKDDFAKRWCALTEVKERQAAATAELIGDIHSSDRIERLTGNPMLLTTMALVKRKVGKLPNRRADLYWSAVEVLLNWRGEVDAPLDHHEAVPQLEYIAYAMCQMGTQRLREDEILGLLEEMREEYPQIHAIHQRRSHDFLHELERRTAILMESGHVRHRGRPIAVFEFRHLTFQEYLAGLALVDGRHPQRDRSLSLAERVARLAGKRDDDQIVISGLQDHWGEALRLCVTSCGDDDVDDVLLAILGALNDAQPRSVDRAILAAECLTDEPNASAHVATTILEGFADAVSDAEPEELDDPDEELWVDLIGRLYMSRWAGELRRILVTRFVEGSTREREVLGSAVVVGDELAALTTKRARNGWFAARAGELEVHDGWRDCEAALRLMQAGFLHRSVPAEALGIRDSVSRRLVTALVSMLVRGDASAYAAAWALMWLCHRERPERRRMPEDAEPARETQLLSLDRESAGRIMSYLQQERREEWIARFLLNVLGSSRVTAAVDVVAGYTGHPQNEVAEVAARVLGEIGSVRARSLLYELVERDDRLAPEAMRAFAGVRGRLARDAAIAGRRSSHSQVRSAAIGMSLTKLSKLERMLLSEDFDGSAPFIDPAVIVSAPRLRAAIQRTGRDEDDVREAYKRLAQELELKLAW